MNDSRSDSALVAAHLGGDQSALADIYDRHGAALYDTAAAMLHDRDEAADVVQDVFTIALQRLHQLRQPERLRPWLFAILRNEVYRSTRRRSRQRPTDFTTAAKAMADTGQTDDSGSMDVVALAAAARTAAAGLDRRDQMILELSSRQGLDGDDLADALGVSRQQCHVLVHRMRQRVSRSLGALTVARMGRADCERLGTILRGWDGTFSVQVRKRVAAHVDDCSTCQTTQQRFTVVSLMGLAPALVAPAALRDTVLRSAASSRASTVRPGKTEPSTGFPRSGSRRNLRVAGVVTAVMVVLTALFWVAGRGPLASSTRDSDTTRPTIVTTTAVATTTPAAITTTETNAATTSATTTADTTTTVGPTSEPTTTPQPTTSELPPPPPPAPGRLQLSTSDIDLGATATQASLTLRNAGGQPIDWQVIGETAPLVWSATEGALAAGVSRRATRHRPQCAGRRTGRYRCQHCVEQRRQWCTRRASHRRAAPGGGVGSRRLHDHLPVVGRPDGCRHRHGRERHRQRDVVVGRPRRAGRSDDDEPVRYRLERSPCHRTSVGRMAMDHHSDGQSWQHRHHIRHADCDGTLLTTLASVDRHHPCVVDHDGSVIDDNPVAPLQEIVERFGGRVHRLDRPCGDIDAMDRHATAGEVGIEPVVGDVLDDQESRIVDGNDKW
jgi:RNA polymerase sigma factor (sigma-70 family)